MATYKQWERTRKTSLLAWVCGDQPALVRVVLDTYRAGFDAASTWALWADDEESRDIWDELLTAPTLNPRLIIVHRAEKLGASLDRMADLVTGNWAGSYAVFVSDEADFARTESDGKKALAPHLAALQGARDGQLVRCCAPSKYDDQVALVATWWPDAGTNHARRVLRLCGGDLTLAAEACAKAVRAQLAPTDKHAAVVCDPGHGAAFADPLVAGDKEAAMAAAQRAGPGETGAGIGLLASRLTMLAAIADALRAGASPAELPYRVRGIDRWLLGRLAPYAAAYDAARVCRCRELLAMAEHFWRSGAAAGVAEAVVALWLVVVMDMSWRVYCQAWLPFFTSMGTGTAGRAECRREFDERYRGRVEEVDWRILTSEEDAGRSFLQLRVPNCTGEFTDQAAAEQRAGEHGRHPHQVVPAGSDQERELTAYGTRRLQRA